MPKTGYVYICTNKNKTVLYIGVTSDLKSRIWTHEHRSAGFVKRYNCHYCVHFERINGMAKAIAREKELEGWKRSRKEELISASNPLWTFLNERIYCEEI